MHDQVHLGQLLVNFLDNVHRQDFTIRFATELVGAVPVHRDRERVHPGAGNEIDRLVGIGQQLLLAQTAFEAVAIFFLAFAGFERTESNRTHPRPRPRYRGQCG